MVEISDLSQFQKKKLKIALIFSSLKCTGNISPCWLGQSSPFSVRNYVSACVSMNRIWNVFLNIKNKNMIFSRLLLIRINYFEVVLSLDEVGSGTLCVYSVEPLLCL